MVENDRRLWALSRLPDGRYLWGLLARCRFADGTIVSRDMARTMYRNCRMSGAQGYVKVRECEAFPFGGEALVLGPRVEIEPGVEPAASEA
jgi:hypothetical protein